MNAVSGRSNLHQAARVLLALGKEELYVLQHPPQEFPDSQIAGQRAVGDASIYHRNRCAGESSPAQEVRPEFTFRQDQQLRPQRLQVRAHRERQIERKIENVVLAEALTCQLLTG